MSFNPDLFLDTRTTEANADRRIPIPEGEYKFLQIKSLEAKPTKNPKYASVMVVFVLEKNPILEKTFPGREEITVTGRINIELNAQNGIATGDNINVEWGQLRSAVNLNQPGMPFAPRMLVGRGPGLLHVSHRPNEEDPMNPFIDVGRFVKAPL